jgi:hypothetical protein
MKLVYIHIPKTGGTSINYELQKRQKGVWLKNAELEVQTKSIFNNEYLSGHFTKEEFDQFITKHGVSKSDFKVMTVVRHPLDQLFSNLNFPFELKARNANISEQWMLDIIQIDSSSPDDLVEILSKHTWLLNIQWQYIVTGATLAESLKYFDHISIFPHCKSALGFAFSIINPKQVTYEMPHINKSSSIKPFEKKLFNNKRLKQKILKEHSLDIELYLTILNGKLSEYGLDAAKIYLPNSVQSFFNEWITK